MISHIKLGKSLSRYVTVKLNLTDSGFIGIKLIPRTGILIE